MLKTEIKKIKDAGKPLITKVGGGVSSADRLQQ